MILPIIENRWSPRAFSSREVSPQQVKTLLKAASMAPSAFNDQPWAFLVGFKGDGSWNTIFDTLADGNKVWAESAPVLLMAMGRKHWLRDKTTTNPTWKYDLGQSVAFLTLQASEMGLWVHQMGGFDHGKAIQSISIPISWEPVVAIAVGYLGDAGQLPPDLAALEKGPKKRKEFSNFVFFEKFGVSDNRFEE